MNVGDIQYRKYRVVSRTEFYRTGLLSLFLLSTVYTLFFPHILCAQPSSSDNMGVAVIIGKNHAWMVEAPEKWVLDPEDAAASRLGAAFHPSDQEWSKAGAVMYANTVLKQSDSVTVESVIAGDMKRAEQRMPKMTVSESAPIGTIEGVDARVCHFVRSDSSLFEAVAYIDGPTVVALVILSARTAKDFRESLSAFARLVDSYEWITDDPDRIPSQ